MHGDEHGSWQSPLDPAERRLLQLLVSGLSSREVAEQTGLPVDAVRAHVGDLIGKLGARSKLEALIVAIRHGLIEVPPMQQLPEAGHSRDGRPGGPMP